MRALDRDKMLQNAQQSPHQTNMAYSLPVNENGHQQRPQRPKIGQFVHTFLDNIKVSAFSSEFYLDPLP
jgi:hypothetical protein